MTQHRQNPDEEPVGGPDSGPDTGPDSGPGTGPDRLLEPRTKPPVGRWRRWLHRATLGRVRVGVNVGDADAVRRQRIAEHRIAAALPLGTQYVPVLSRQGGVGKTTVTTLLGMALAQIREDRIIAVDAGPGRGTLADRSSGKATYTARQLARNRFMADSLATPAADSARDAAGECGSRLHILAADADPRVGGALDDADHRAMTDQLSRFYSIVLTDSGAGMVHAAMQGTLDKADAVVLVSGADAEEARLASETLSWLEAHGCGDLAGRAIVVINQPDGQDRGADVEEIEAHFRTRVPHVIRLPHDPHLAEGSRIEPARLRPATRTAVLELAALVVDELKD